MNAFAYKEIFPLFQENQVWYGATAAGKRLWFGVPEHYQFTGAENDRRIDENGRKFIRIKGVIRWFTNLDHKFRHEQQVLWNEYDPIEHPKYDNYDAIEVGKTKHIPKNYDGAMGVPISFMDKYNPNQFEILGITNRDRDHPLKCKIYQENDHPRFNDFNASPCVLKDGELENLYTRVFIRRKQ